MDIIPHLFTCPISLELFRDPVTICTGQTYDRPCIEKWIGSGNLTCPITMQKLHDLSMVPNNTLRHLIDQWLQIVPHQFHNHHNSHDYCFSNVGCCYNVSFPSLKHTLESNDTTFEQKVGALEQVRCLLEDLLLPMRSNDGLIIQLGFLLPLLLRLVFGSQRMMVLVEKALECVVKMLPYCELSHLNMIIHESNFETFKVLLKEGTCMVKISLYNLIQVIFISSSFETQELVTKIGNEKKVLKELITSLSDQSHELIAEAIMKAILGMLTSSSSQECHKNLIEEGLVHTLVTYILKVEKQEKKNLLAPKATRAVEMILQQEQGGKESFLVNGIMQKNGVKALVKMVFRVSGDEEGSESAVNSLMILCCESKQVREEAINVGILTQLLLLLQSQCSGRTKTRARMLLKLLRSMCLN